LDIVANLTPMSNVDVQTKYKVFYLFKHYCGHFIQVAVEPKPATREIVKGTTLLVVKNNIMKKKLTKGALTA
jgi:hypothetical protein